MSFILGRQGKEDKLLARCLWFLMLALFVASITFSVDALGQNADLFASSSGYTVEPIVADGFVGLMLRIIICTASSTLCWVLSKTYVTNPFGLPLVVEQVLAAKAKQGVKIGSIVISVLILVLMGGILFFAYRFDLLTASVGMGIPLSLNLMSNPMSFSVLMVVFGPEVISVALTSREGVQQALGGGDNSTVPRLE